MATYRFNVSFDAAAEPSLAVTINPPGNVSVPPDEISLLTFALSGPQGAAFPSTPIQWQDDTGQQIDAPPWLVLHRHADNYFTLWDFNSTPSPTDHRFKVAVSHQGQTFLSQDPVIVNEAPSG